MRVGDKVLVQRPDEAFTGVVLGQMNLRCRFLRLRPLIIIRDDAGKTQYVYPGYIRMFS